MRGTFHLLLGALLLGLTPQAKAAISMDTTGLTLSTDNFTHNQWLGNRIRLAETAEFQSPTSISVMLDVVYGSPYLSAFILEDIGAEPNKAKIIAEFGLNAASTTVAETPGGVNAVQLIFDMPRGSAGVMEPGKNYWVVAGVTDVNHNAATGQQMGLMHWYWASSYITSADGWTVDPWLSISNTNGVDWSSFSGSPYVFGMTTIVVPEPSRAVLMLAGLLAVLSRRRRLAVLPLLLCSCEPEAQKAAPKPALAVVGTETIRVEDFQSAAQRRGGGDREALLDELITESALVQRAQALKLDQSPEYRRRTRALLIAMLREKEPSPPAAPSPTPQQLQSLYEELKPKLQTPAARQLAVLRLTEGREKLAEAVKRFQALPADPARRGFGPIAAEFSEDQDTRYLGGDLGWLTAEDIQRRLPAPVAQAAQSLKSSGQCSNVITDGPASYVVLLIALRESSVMPFEQARPRLLAEFNLRQSALAAQKQREIERQGLHIEIDHALLQSLSLESKPSPPPEVPQQ